MFKFFSSLFKRNSAAQKESCAHLCGHPVSGAVGTVRAFGSETETGMPKNSAGGYDFCHACLGEMAIRCWLCGEPIFIGDPITLYSPGEKGPPVPPYAATYSFQPLQLVGCGRRSCADTGADYCGYWSPAKVRQNGKWVGGVLRFESGLEKALRTNEVVVINNLHDQDETKPDPRVVVPVLMPLTT